MEINKAAEIKGQKETARIEAFSDGVFCVAVTLLAIEIGVEVNKDETNAGLAASIFKLWPVILAYFISFVNILLAWIGHHGLFENLHDTDSFVMITNGLLLMLIALVPFPTKTLGLFLETDAFKTAVIFYTGYFVLISLAFLLLWHAASRKQGLLIHGFTAAQIKLFTRNENIGLFCNSIILATAFISPWVALAFSFVMWIYWIVFA
ncbi:TMEM175 family protein [soil metagenome]